MTNDYETNGKRVSDLDLKENEKACYYRFFTNTPCTNTAVWYNTLTGSKWCKDHKDIPDVKSSLVPLCLVLRGPDDVLLVRPIPTIAAASSERNIETRMIFHKRK